LCALKSTCVRPIKQKKSRGNNTTEQQTFLKVSKRFTEFLLED